MTKDEVYENVKKIFDDFFAANNVKVDMETTSEDIKQWDSIAQIQLIFQIENVCNIQFEAEEISNLKSIKKIVDSVILKF